MVEPLKRSDVEALAEQVRALLDEVDAGDMTARAAMRARLEGALAALEIVLGRRSSLTEDQ